MLTDPIEMYEKLVEALHWYADTFTPLTVIEIRELYDMADEYKELVSRLKAEQDVEQLWKET
jgi:hypothetical protein